jgi:hypothetical protein
MPDQDRDLVDLDDVGPRRLCIVARDPLVCGPFIAALQTVLRRDEEFEIIQDRRRNRSALEAKPDVADQPFVDRRRHPHVDRLLKMDGFAIVAAPGTGKRHGLSFFPPPAPIEALAPDGEDTDELERLESVRGFRRRQALWLVSWLILVGLLSASAVLFLFSPAEKTLMTLTQSAAPPAASQPRSAERINAPPAVVQAPPVAEPSPVTWTPSLTENASPNVPTPALPPASVSKSPEPLRPPQARTSSRAVSGPIASVPRVANVQRPAATPPEVTPPRFVGLPKVELIRSPVPAAEGQGTAYGVRISDRAGRPLAGADVLLFVRMADGSVGNIPLDPGPEPGTYHGTAPPTWAAAVNLRLRVTTSEERVELPLAP